MSLMSFVSLVLLIVFQIAVSRREGFVLSSFCLFFRGKGYFNSLVGRVRDSFSAGQDMTYVSVLGAYSSFVEGWVD